MPTTSRVASPSFQETMDLLASICAEVVGPAADDVDRDARFPHEAFEALRSANLLSAYVPAAYGGAGFSLREICRLCELLGNHCASTAMVFAMHQIQVACLVHHGAGDPYWDGVLHRTVEDQILFASATTEIGVGGDVRTSICAVEVDGDRFRIEKHAPVISYALESDVILVTCRRGPDEPGHNQALVLVETTEAELEPLSGWDTLGFRGTRSLGFTLRAEGEARQIFTKPYAEILAETMHPFSHLVWGSLWYGLAHSAVVKARSAARKKMRRDPEGSRTTALRLAEVDELLFEMRSGLYRTIDEYQSLLDAGDPGAFADYGFSLRINNTKITCSEKVVGIVGGALQVIGIGGYRNDSDNSLSRQLRDAYGAALMVNNDRIRGHNATMQVMSGS